MIIENPRCTPPRRQVMVHTGACSCGYKCTATTPDGVDACLFLHVIHSHTVEDKPPVLTTESAA